MSETKPQSTAVADEEWEFPATSEPQGIRSTRSYRGNYRKWKESIPDLTIAELRAEAGRLHLRGKTLTEIAELINVPRMTVADWVRQCKEAWKDRAADDMHVELAKVDELEAFAWERLEQSLNPESSQKIERELSDVTRKMAETKRVLTRTKSNGSKQWADVIQWCIDYRTKVKGGYAPDRLRIEGEFRVAGQSRDDFYKELAARIAKAAEATN